MEYSDFPNLTHNQFVLFLTVFDLRSVSKAAEILGKNQSTVSYSLDRLREEFDDSLFVKSGKGVVATDFAVSIAPQIRSIVRDMQSLSIKSKYLPAKDSRRIVIATNATEFDALIKRVITELRLQAPAADLGVVELGSRENVAYLLNHNLVDVVAAIKPDNLPGSLSSETVFEDEIVCFYDKDVRGPVNSVEEFVQADHAILDFGGQSASTLGAQLAKNGLTRRIRMRAPNAYTLGSVVRGTSMVASMHKSLSQSEFFDLAFCDHPLELPRVNFSLIWHKKNEYSERNIWIRNIFKTKIYLYNKIK